MLGRFDRCEASQGGGAALSHANWAHQAGNLHALDCQAREGGGFHVAQSTMEQLGGTMFFKRCNATKDGGCIETVRSSFNQLEEGTLRFEECNATRLFPAVSIGLVLLPFAVLLAHHYPLKLL